MNASIMKLHVTSEWRIRLFDDKMRSGKGTVKFFSGDHENATVSICHTGKHIDRATEYIIRQ